MIARRRMTRSFGAEALDENLLARILEAARRAPSAGFAQGVDLLVLTGDEARRRFWELGSTEEWRRHGRQAPGLMAAPAIVVPVADPGAYVARYAGAGKSRSGLAGRTASEWPVPYWTVDSAFAVMSMLLSATGAGVGALFFRIRAEPARLLRSFGAPADRVLIGAVALGHPAPPPPRPAAASPRPARRLLSEVVHRDTW